jgi:hypothetical protein
MTDDVKDPVEIDDAKGLSPRQRDVILALADARTVAGAARQAGVARSSVYVWLQDERFRAEVGRVRDLLFQEALDVVNGAMAKAVDKLVGMLEHGSSTIRLKAASELARLGMEIRERAEIESKIKELEERASRMLGGRRD